MVETTILSPCGILGYGFPEASLKRAMAQRPDAIIVDAGSTDAGPHKLGAGVAIVSRQAAKIDLARLMNAARAAGIPLLIGSAGGSGARKHTLWTMDIIEEIAREMGISESKVREIMKIAQEPVSLETPIGEEEDSHLGDFIADDTTPTPAETASFALMKEQLQDVLDTLTPREKKVLTLRFGLEDGRLRTLEEVGREFNVTRERIRQIEAKALRKLRHPSRSKKLRDYLD